MCEWYYGGGIDFNGVDCGVEAHLFNQKTLLFRVMPFCDFIMLFFLL